MIREKEVEIREVKFKLREPLFKDFMEAYRKAKDDMQMFNIILLSKCIIEPEMDSQKIMELPMSVVTKLIMELADLIEVDRKNLFTVLGPGE